MKMIKTRDDLRRYVDVEKKLYLGEKTYIQRIKERLLRTEDYLLWRYVYLMRKAEYYGNNGNPILFMWYQRRKNILGVKLNITIRKNNFNEGVRIWHSGIIINGYAKIGKNCQLHGFNCIGNKGGADEKAPILGDNVDVGVGAKIIGNIYIADGVRIGANAVVNKSCYKKNAMLVGVPAKIKETESNIEDRLYKEI